MPKNVRTVGVWRKRGDGLLEIGIQMTRGPIVCISLCNGSIRQGALFEARLGHQSMHMHYIQRHAYGPPCLALPSLRPRRKTGQRGSSLVRSLRPFRQIGAL